MGKGSDLRWTWKGVLQCGDGTSKVKGLYLGLEVD